MGITEATADGSDIRVAFTSGRMRNIQRSQRWFALDTRLREQTSRLSLLGDSPHHTS